MKQKMLSSFCVCVSAAANCSFLLFSERNYKEAKRLSEEIKELTSCGENKQRDIEELIPQIKDRKNEIERLQKKISIEEKTCGELKYAQGTLLNSS